MEGEPAAPSEPEDDIRGWRGMDWPEAQDVGRRVELILADDSRFIGVLAERRRPGEDEEILDFAVIGDDGSQVALSESCNWRFVGF